MLGSTEDLLDSVIMSLKSAQAAWCFMSSIHVQLHGCRPGVVESWMLPGVGFFLGKGEEGEGYGRHDIN